MPLRCSSFEVSFSLKLPWPLGTKLPWNLLHPLPWSVVSICPWLWVYIYGNACPVLRSSPCWKPCTQCGVAIVSSPKPWFKVARAWLKLLIRLLSQSLEKGFMPPWRWEDRIISRHVPYGEEAGLQINCRNLWKSKAEAMTGVGFPSFLSPTCLSCFPRCGKSTRSRIICNKLRKKCPSFFDWDIF